MLKKQKTNKTNKTNVPTKYQIVEHGKVNKNYSIFEPHIVCTPQKHKHTKTTQYYTHHQQICTYAMASAVGSLNT